MKRIIFLLAAVFGCLQSSYGVVSDLPDREGPVDFATDITDKTDVQPTPRVVTCSARYIFHDDVFTITVHDSCPKVTYSLYKYNKLVGTAVGTGADLIFTGAFGEGYFKVIDDTGQEMKNTVSPGLYWPLFYQFHKGIMTPELPIDINGGVVELDLYTGTPLELVGMSEMFDRFNAGDFPDWDPQTMRIIAESRETINDASYIYHVKIYSAPNVTTNTIYNHTGFDVMGASYHSIYQYYGGVLTDWDVQAKSNSVDGDALILTNTQPLVTYELYNGGKLIASKLQEPEKELLFERLPPGLYTVRATYKTASKEHDGIFKVQFHKYIQQNPLITYGSESSLTLSKEGGTCMLSCKRDTIVDETTIKQVIQEFNSENQSVKMNLIDSSESRCNIELVYKPNFSNKELIIDSKFIFNGNSHISIIQPGSGDINVYDVVSGMEPQPFIKLTGSQVGVNYEVLKNGNSVGITASGTGESIEFSNVPTGFVYTVRGTKPGHLVQGKPIACDMNGFAVLITNPEDNITSSTNAISTKTYYDGTHSYADITYYDGFGAPYQTVLNRAAPDGRNLVAPILYDDMYRDKATVLLPFPVDMYTGERVLNAEQEQRRYYSQRTDGVQDNSAYSTNVFDKSGLDRIRYSYRPGDIYRQENKFAEYLYETNDTADKVLDFKYNYEDGSITVAGYAKAGLYTKNTVIDEDGNTSARFADANGNTVLDRRYFSRSYFTDTYYVYDPCFNRLVWVISPEGSARIRTAGTVLRWDDDTANQYCYRYLYDGRGNMIERKLPGCEKKSFVYDKGDRLVFSRDGNLQARKQWLYHVYDNQGNLLRQNLLDYDISREQLQSRYETLVDNLLPALGGTTDMDLPYDSDGGATLSRKLAHYVFGNVEYSETATGFVETTWTAPVDMAYRGVGFPGTPLQDPKGLKTYEKLAVLGDDAGEPRYVERTYFYDYKKRLMQVVERNPEGGISRTSYDYDLVGNVVRYKELRQPYAGADEDMVTASYVYDNRRRLIREVRALNYENSVAVDYEYDDLGKLVGKTTRNGGLNTTMAYNLQGWQTDMQVTNSGSPLFDTHLRYYDPQYGETTPSYAGNISEWTWRQGVESDENTYAFTYDSHSRLTDTKQYINGMPDNQFIETGFSYDLNSNIKALKRYDKGILKDSYNYNYLGNQLLAIYVRPVSSRNAVPQSVDFASAVPVIPRDTIYSGVGYVYDSAGNVLYDSHAGLNLRYNDLNLIEKVMRGDTIVAKYSYLSDGTKLSATDSAGNGLYYSGSLVYSKQGASLTMESCAFTGGRFVATATGVEARYFVTDHLGSVRAVVNGDGEVLERNDYYPFGSRWDDGLLSDNRYRYNGKEAQAFLNNPYLDYGARQYDSDGGIWLGKDPLSEKYYPISPYSFCANNPIKFVDLDGRKLRPAGEAELNMIRNTVPQNSRQYISLDENGYIDQNQLDLYQGNSLNYNNIKEIVAADVTMEVRLDDKFSFVDKNGHAGTATMSYFPYDSTYPEDKDVDVETVNGISTGETGFTGKTLFPDKDGMQNSPSDNIVVIVHNKLSPMGAAEMYSHEANGHGLLYIRNGGDHAGASHNVINLDGKLTETNEPLKIMIIQSRRETINNMR
ncbi:RHS repeat domain-containing protein [Alistipes onderdonkii]|jgi:RHS repeat-associated protein|uniref:RHS repeat domain-containing protein n=1 Tax=Alistipes onderdonkii TaxID=328813 RepID=UPI001EDF0595|nr:DUF6443 domain-containing protein [Alistipes onderdonkii]MCG4860993.1 RHS repeat-associated core domain-containing protein [Alistipes onderdonkii]